MEDMLSFISKRTKSLDGISIKDLYEACGISRATFYRCLSEPHRFSDSQLEIVSDCLRLNESEKRTLFDFKHGTSSVDKNVIYREIESIIFGWVPTWRHNTSRFIKLFHSSDSNNGAVICSSDEFIQHLIPHLQNNVDPNYPPSFDIYIFNSHSEEKVQTLYSLFSSLSQASVLVNNYTISIHHFINDDSLSSGEKIKCFAFLYRLASLSSFAAYSIHYTNLKDTFLGNTDCCLVHYTDKFNSSRYLLVNLFSKSELTAFSFCDANLYSYLVQDYEPLRIHYDSLHRNSTNSIIVGEDFTRNTYQYKTLLITRGPCFNNFLPALWESVKKKALTGIDAEARLAEIRRQADPDGIFRAFDDYQFVDKLLESFSARFQASEATGAITLISTNGLKDFAETGTTTEISPTGIFFNVPDRIAELEYIQKNLGNKSFEVHQSYYLINPMCQIPDTAFVVFRDFQILVYFHVPGHPNAYCTLIPEVDMASEFYDYVANELIPSPSRGQFGSMLMSDKQARDYIDSLLKDLRAKL